MPTGNPLLDTPFEQLSPDDQAAYQRAQAKAAALINPNGAPSDSMASTVAQAPATQGTIPPPQQIRPAAQRVAPISLPAAQPEPAGMAADRAEVARLTGAGPNPNEGKSGIAQIKHAGARIPLQILDALGSTFFPGTMALLPGTELHHQRLVSQARENLKSDLEQQKEQNEAGLQQAQTANQLSEANARNNPTAKAPTNEIELFLNNPDKFAQYRALVQKAQATKEPQFIKDADQNIIGMIDGSGALHSKSDPDLDPQARAIMEAAQPKVKAPTTPFELWVRDNPNGTAQQFKDFSKTTQEGKELSAEDQAIIRAVGGDPTVPVAQQPLAVLQKYLAKKKEGAPEKPLRELVTDKAGHVTEIRGGSTLPEGSTSVTQLGAQNVKAAEQAQAEQKAIEDNKKSYQLAQQFASHPSGPNDVALTMQFIGMVKPEAMGKIRFTPQEQNFVIGARSSFGDLDALLNKVTNGQRLTAEQRNQMLETMRIMSNPGTVAVPGDTGGAIEYVRDPKTGKLVRK